jgi:hypothetical protein
MKKRQAIFLIIFAFLLAGCITPAQQVMPALQYNHAINFHVDKNVYLSLQSEKEYSSRSQPAVFYTPNLIASVVATALYAGEREGHPEKYTYTYGAAQKTVFMASLRNALEKHHVFNHVKLAEDAVKLNSGSNDVLITVNFKNARVASSKENYKIVLDVELIIKTNGEANGKTFTRTYLVESNAGERFVPVGFKEQQSDVSQQLLRKIIAGIQAWDAQKNSLPADSTKTVTKIGN